MRDTLIRKVSHMALGAAWNGFFRSSYSISTLRRNFDLLAAVPAARLKNKFPDARFEMDRIEGFPVERIQVGPVPARTILYLHGGAYCMGGIPSYRRFGMRMAYRWKARVVLLDYPLAPEHPYPAAVECAKRVLTSLIRAEGTEKVVVGGDSAGGGLTLAVLLALRDAGEQLPSRAFCLSPWTDLLMTGSSLKTNARRDLWLSKVDAGVWADMYAKKSERGHSYISPLYGDFKGLPPLAILVGEDEVLLDDAVRVAKSAKAAGVPVTFHVGPQMQHVWPIPLPWLRESKHAMRVLGEFLDSGSPLSPPSEMRPTARR